MGLIADRVNSYGKKKKKTRKSAVIEAVSAGSLPKSCSMERDYSFSLIFPVCSRTGSAADLSSFPSSCSITELSAIVAQSRDEAPEQLSRTQLTTPPCMGEALNQQARCLAPKRGRAHYNEHDGWETIASVAPAPLIDIPRAQTSDELPMSPTLRRWLLRKEKAGIFMRNVSMCSHPPGRFDRS